MRLHGTNVFVAYGLQVVSSYTVNKEQIKSLCSLTNITSQTDYVTLSVNSYLYTGNAFCETWYLSSSKSTTTELFL